MKKTLSLLGPALLVFATAWLLVAMLVGLSAGPPSRPELVLSVRDDSGGPLAEVPVLAAGRRLGASDAQGSFRYALAPRERLRVEVRCPEAYRPAPPQAFVLPEAAQPLVFICRPRLRTLAVVALAPSARGLMLRAGAQNLGRIDDSGVLHAVLRRAPGSTVLLSLEGRALAEVSATRTLVVEDRDGIVLFDPARP
jgi:hypothetical protein